MAAMQALSKPFVGQKIECRSARQSQRATISLVVRASQEEQTVVCLRQTVVSAAAPSVLKTLMCSSMSFLRTAQTRTPKIMQVFKL